MIRFNCPQCGLALKASEGAEGRRSYCPCGANVIVPGEVAERPDLHVRERATVARPSASALPEIDELEIESSIDLARRKRRRMREILQQRLRAASPPIGFAALFASLGGSGLVGIAAMSPSFFVNPFIMPAIGLSLAGIIAGVQSQLLSTGPDRRAKAGVWIGGIALAAIVAAFFASMDRWHEIAQALDPRRS
jgi:hypothetical protein